MQLNHWKQYMAMAALGALMGSTAHAQNATPAAKTPATSQTPLSQQKPGVVKSKGAATAKQKKDSAKPAPLAGTVPAMAKDLPKESVLKPKPVFPTAAPEQRKFTVEYVYNYTKLPYTPAVRLESVTRAQASYKTPEESLIAMYSAMVAGDYDWWASLWDKKSQEQNAERNRQMNRTPEYWRQKWEQNVKGKVAVLHERLESGPYVMLTITIADPKAPNTKPPYQVVVFKVEDNRWVATQELSTDDFLSTYYNQGEMATLQRNSSFQPVEMYQGGVWRTMFAQNFLLSHYQPNRDLYTKEVR